MRRSERLPALALRVLAAALGSSATAATISLITGRQVKDASLTGADLADRSIGARKLRAASLTGASVRAGSLTTREVRDGTLVAEDLSSGAIARLAGLAGAAGPAGAQGPTGPAGPQGPTGVPGAAGSGIKLAGHVQVDAQTLPGDSVFHQAWSMSLSAGADQLFIVTGSIGNATAGCSLDQRITVDGTPDPSVFNGGFLRFSPGSHTIAYELSAGCPIDVPAQEAIVIPFTLP